MLPGTGTKTNLKSYISAGRTLHNHRRENLKFYDLKQQDAHLTIPPPPFLGPDFLNERELIIT